MAGISRVAVVLDAMGVVYQPADDLRDLLVPFVRSKGCRKSATSISRLYKAASRGTMTSAELWDRLGVAGDGETLDRELVAQYTLTNGVRAFLEWCADIKVGVQCITNDLSEWASLRADRLQVSTKISRWTVSAAVGCRKPDIEIFRAFTVSATSSLHLFVDDRLENVMGAVGAGMRGVWFTQERMDTTTAVMTARNFESVAAIVSDVLNDLASHSNPLSP